MLWRLHVASLLTLTTITLAALGPVSELILTSNTISPDGFPRAASVINGMHPGPVIAVNKGDQLKINAVNQLSDPSQLRGTSIHWHGILQKGTSYMDGTVGVSQCPISPNNSFQYVFTADVAGTYWYHSHYGVQYCDGVRGVIVVYDPNDPLKNFYDIDSGKLLPTSDKIRYPFTSSEQTIITLSEWYHTLATSIHGAARADSTLINGKGRYPGGPNSDLAVVTVQQGKRYRLRLVSISCEPNFTFSVDHHDLIVIEVEGTAVQPYTVNTIQFLAGQRYSAVLHANQTIGNYWIRALPNTGNQNLNSTFANGVNSAILRYNGAANADPTSTQQTTQNKLIETSLRPTFNTPAPGAPNPNGADYTFNLTFGFDADAFLFSVNGIAFTPPTVPVLLQIASGARSPHELLPQGAVFVVERNKSVQVNMPSGLIGGPHPYHMHGHPFHVVRSADSGYFDFLNPVQRDVVNAGDTQGDYISIRFMTDNPGPWIVHCHIDFHLHEGLAFVFAEAPDDTVPLDPVATSGWDQLCPTWNALPEDIENE